MRAAALLLLTTLLAPTAWATNAVVNVTQKVADWIEDSLTVEATAENFGDPANGIEKQLKVDYTLDGVDGTVTVEEGQLLKLDK